MQVLIYRLTSPSGKSYIGQTRHPLRVRLGQHASPCSGCVALARAIKKYGVESFVLEELLRVPLVLANDAEARLIKTYKTLAPGGYNLRSGGGQNSTVAPETRERLSAAGKISQRIRFSNPENVATARVLLRRNQGLPGAREKMLAAIRSPEAVRRRVEGLRRPEVRERTSRAIKARLADPEILAAQLSKLNTPEAQARSKKTIAKLLEDPATRADWVARTKSMHTPEARAKGLVVLRKVRASPEFIKERSETTRALWADPGYRSRMVESRRLAREAARGV